MSEEELFNRVKEFANKIIPRNWAICYRLEDCRFCPGSLNIMFSELPDCENVDPWEYEEEFEDYRIGETGPMSFHLIGAYRGSDWFPVDFPANRDECHVAQVDLRIRDSDRIECTVIHELAHIAAMRLWARKWKRDERQIIGRPKEDMHGPIFQEAYRILILRAEKAYGKEMTKENWFELRLYQEHRGE